MADLYAAKGASQSTSDLYKISRTDGSVLADIGPIGFALTGLAWDLVGGVMYGSTSNNSASHPAALISVNLSTGAGTLIADFSGDTGGGGTCADLACDSAGNLYGIISYTGRLVSVNKTTGVCTNISPANVSAFGEGFDIDGADKGWVFNQGDGGSVYALDISTGLLTPALPLTGGTNHSIPAGAFDNAGTFFGVEQFGGSSATARNLDTWNATGAKTVLGALPTYIDAIAWNGSKGTSVFPLPPPPPSNDNFANAQVLTGTSGSVAGTTVSATPESPDPLHTVIGFGSDTVWYKYTPASNCVITLTLTGALAGHGAMGIFTGSSLSTLVPVITGAVDVLDGVPLTAGTTYYIEIAGRTFAGNRLAFTLGWTTAPVPPSPTNNNCAHALDLGTVAGDLGDFDNRYVAGGWDMADHLFAFYNNGGGAPLWFKFTNPGTVTVTLDFSFRNPTTGTFPVNGLRIWAYRGTCGSLTGVGSPGSGINGFGAFHQKVDVAPGETIYLEVDAQKTNTTDHTNPPNLEFGSRGRFIIRLGILLAIYNDWPDGDPMIDNTGYSSVEPVEEVQDYIEFGGTSLGVVWEFNESSGSVAHCSSATYDLAVTSAGWGGPSGPPGTPSAVVSNSSMFANSAFPALTGDFIASVYVYITDNLQSWIMGQGNTGGVASGWAMNMEAFNTGLGGPRITLTIGTTGGGTVGLEGDSIVAINTWHKMEVRRTGNTWVMFLNGVAQTATYTGPYTPPTPAGIWFSRYSSFGLLGFNGYMSHAEVTWTPSSVLMMSGVVTGRMQNDAGSGAHPAYEAKAAIRLWDGANRTYWYPTLGSGEIWPGTATGTGTFGVAHFGQQFLNLNTDGTTVWFFCTIVKTVPNLFNGGTWDIHCVAAFTWNGHGFTRIGTLNGTVWNGNDQYNAGVYSPAPSGSHSGWFEVGTWDISNFESVCDNAGHCFFMWGEAGHEGTLGIVGTNWRSRVSLSKWSSTALILDTNPFFCQTADINQTTFPFDDFFTNGYAGNFAHAANGSYSLVRNGSNVQLFYLDTGRAGTAQYWGYIRAYDINSTTLALTSRCLVPWFQPALASAPAGDSTTNSNFIIDAYAIEVDPHPDPVVVGRTIRNCAIWFGSVPGTSQQYTIVVAVDADLSGAPYGIDNDPTIYGMGNVNPAFPSVGGDGIRKHSIYTDRFNQIWVAHGQLLYLDRKCNHKWMTYTTTTPYNANSIPIVKRNGTPTVAPADNSLIVSQFYNINKWVYDEITDHVRQGSDGGITNYHIGRGVHLCQYVPYVIIVAPDSVSRFWFFKDGAWHNVGDPANVHELWIYRNGTWRQAKDMTTDTAYSHMDSTWKAAIE